jgi:hypothetical protein
MLTHSSAASPEIFLMTFSRCGSFGYWGYLPAAIVVDALLNAFLLGISCWGGGGHNRSAPPMGGGARALTGIDRAQALPAREL